MFIRADENLQFLLSVHDSSFAKVAHLLIPACWRQFFCEPGAWSPPDFVFIKPSQEGGLAEGTSCCSCRTHSSQTPSVNQQLWFDSAWNHLITLAAEINSLSLSLSQTGSLTTGRPSFVRWLTWSTMTTLAMRLRRVMPCEGRLTGKCTTSEYPSLRSCRRTTQVNLFSEFSLVSFVILKSLEMITTLPQTWTSVGVTFSAKNNVSFSHLVSDWESVSVSLEKQVRDDLNFTSVQSSP